MRTPDLIATTRELDRRVERLELLLAARLAAISGITTAEIATSQGTTSGSYTDLATSGPTITLVVPANGRLHLAYGAGMTLGSAALAALAPQLSGANTLAAADSNATYMTPAGTFGFGREKLLTGLNAGTTTIQIKYRANGAVTATFSDRWIIARIV